MTLNVFPDLTTEGLQLRQIQASDAVALFSYFSNDEYWFFTK